MPHMHSQITVLQARPHHPNVISGESGSSLASTVLVTMEMEVPHVAVYGQRTPRYFVLNDILGIRDSTRFHLKKRVRTVH